MATVNSMARLVDPATLLLTIRGVKARLEEVLGVSNFSLQFHNNWKQGLRASKAEGTNYPHGGFKMTNITITENNAKNMMRVGTGDGVRGDVNNAIISRSFLVPAKLSLECEIKFQDVQEAMMFSAAASLFISGGVLGFKIEYGDSVEWHCNVTVGGSQPASMPMPVIDDLNEGSTPGTAGISFSLEVSTKIGFIRDVSKLNIYGEVRFTAHADNSAEERAQMDELLELVNGPQYVPTQSDLDRANTSTVIEKLLHGMRQ